MAIREAFIAAGMAAFIGIGAGVNYLLDNAEEIVPEEQEIGGLTFTQIKPNLYTLTGGVGVGDCEKIVPQLPTDRPFTVILESPGGSLQDGVCLSAHLKLRNVNTVIRDTPVMDENGEILYNPGHYTDISDSLAEEGRDRVVICASACSLLFLGGDERYLMGDVYLGIHSPRSSIPIGDSNAAEAGAYETAAQLMKFLKDNLQVENDDLRRLFITIPASSMYYLNPKHFNESPWLIRLATHYYNFHNFSAVDPNVNVREN